jgi:transcriptional regulator with XRE-family HTH domain
MSQDALAEAMGVSRQAISKWETNASVPELDKLVKLSRLFGVSLDELVTGEAPPLQEPTPAPVAAAPFWSSRKIIGIILLCMAFLVWLWVSTSSMFIGFVRAIPFLLCGLIVLFCRRRTGLWCAWIVYLWLDLYDRWGSRLSWTNAFLRQTYSCSSYSIILTVWGKLLGLLGLLCLTFFLFRHVRIDLKKRRNAFLLAGGWLALVILRSVKPSYDTFEAVFGSRRLVPEFMSQTVDVLLLALFAALLTATVCAFRKRPQP